MVVFKAVHYTEVEMKRVDEEGFEGVSVRWLISERDGAKNFAMRCFEIKPGGKTALHRHDWEHEVFILNGKGTVICGDVEKEISAGYVIFIPPNAPHCFKNTSNEILRFLCLIPYKR